MKTLPDRIPERDELPFWKLFRSARWSVCNAVSIREYRCLMRHRKDCRAGLLIVSGDGFEQLERCDFHDLDSHIRQAAMSSTKLMMGMKIPTIPI
jgi:hypothetical protein